MKKLLLLLAVFGLVAAACGSDDDSAGGEGETLIDELNVAYFSGWPLPPQIGQEDGSFAAAVGAETINWIPLPDGGSMADGMVAGDVDIAYSIGLTPFAVKATQGAPITMVGIAVSYADADNCFVQGDLGYTRDNAAEALNGATILTPIGNVTHYKLLNTLEFLGVDMSTVEILPHESGDSTAASFASGQIQVGCAFGGPLVTMEEAGGVPLLTGEETSNEVGIKTYDVTAVANDFAEENPDVVTGFLRATEEFNEKWAADPDANNPIIATAAGMEEVGNFLSGPTWFTFPTVDEQLSNAWLGSSVASVMKEQLTFFMEQGEVDAVADDYGQFIDTSYLEAIG
ncbi:MAG: ABC transporter substrate-binding protein [Actinomycetota bacterium]